MTPAKIYRFVVPAGGAFQLQALGEYFKVLEASGALEVRGDTFGTVGQLQPGQGLADTPFARLEFRDLSGFANTVAIVLAGANFVDDRVQGVVEVMDGNKARSISGAGYQWRCSSVTTNAANRPVSQLWNPPGSGVRVIVDGLLFGCTVATAINWGAINVAMPNPAASAIYSVLAGGPGPKAVPLVNESAPFPALSSVLGAIYVPASGAVEVNLRRPIVLPPGMGLCAVTDQVGTPIVLSGCMQFFEEAL